MKSLQELFRRVCGSLREVNAAILTRRGEPTDPESMAFEQRQAEHRAEIELLKRHQAELALKIARLARRIDKKNEVRLKAFGKLLYLPRGRVGGCPNGRPYVEFSVGEKTEALLNSMVISNIDEDNPPWLDLQHDLKSRVFDISHFKLEPGGLFCYGQYTALGRRLRHRISGVSATIYTVSVPGEPVFAFGGVDFKTPPLRIKKSADYSTPPADLANMGGVLLDGEQSAYQPLPTPVRTAL